MSAADPSAARPPARLRRARLPSPLGPMVAALRGDALVALGWDDDGDGLGAFLARRYPHEALADEPPDPGLATALAAYFAGDLHALGALVVEAAGTPFQRSVWGALRGVAPGRTTSYGALAAALGQPGAVRAVGAANGANPVALVVPCHRVVGAGGALTGYAAGLDRKRWLLHHERAGQGALFAPDALAAVRQP